MTREREDFFEHLRKPQRPKAGGFSSRNAVRALKESVANVGHKTGLPPRLLDLFSARPRLEPGTDLRTKKPKQPLSGIASYVDKFAAPGDDEYEPAPPSNRPPSPRLVRNPELRIQARIDTETKEEKSIRMSTWKKEEDASKLEDKIREWNPAKDPNVQGDPYRTLFVSRLAYDVDERKLRREFEEFGPIVSIRIVNDPSGRPRGYAFIEYESKKDMKEAYKLADGRKIDGRRVVVDVERGRTVDNWKPRRLGGGLGGQGREAKPSKAQLKAQGLLSPGGGPPAPRGPPGGGFGGPPRDDFRGPPRDDFRGPPRDDFRGPPRGGGGGFDRDRGGGGFDRGAGGDRYERSSSRGGGGGYDRGGGGSMDRDRDRGDRYDRDRKRDRSDGGTARYEEKRHRSEDDRRDRRRERDML